MTDLQLSETAVQKVLHRVPVLNNFAKSKRKLCHGDIFQVTFF